MIVARFHRASLSPMSLATHIVLALGRYDGARLAAIRLAQGARPDDFQIRPRGNADEITEHLDNAAAVRALVRALVARFAGLALGLYGLTESTSFSVAGLSLALRMLDVEPVRPS